jgi:TolB-like protein/Flp pilus assembly protein TadD
MPVRRTASTAATDRREAVQTRIALLPFEDLTANKDFAYLATGLAEETSTSLAKIDLDSASVISHLSLQAALRAGKTLREIGAEFDADYIVASSLRAEHQNVRVTARLVRVADDVQIWAAAFDREVTSVLGLQRELATAIAEQIRLRLSPAVAEALVARQTSNPKAYDDYLRGRHQWSLFTPTSARRAIEHYEQAIAGDPKYALAWAGVAQALCTAPISGDASPQQIRLRADEAVRNAVRYGPQLAEAHYALGYFHLWLDWDWRAAEQALRMAVKIDPNNGIAQMMLGHVWSQMGEQVDATAAMRRARVLEPHFPQTYALSAQVAFQGRDYCAADDFARQAVAMNPEAWVGHLQLGQAQAELGQHEEAALSVERAERYSGGNSKAIAFGAVLAARRGRLAQAETALARLHVRERDQYVPPYAAAIVHAALGAKDDAFAALERAYAVRDVHLAFLPVDCRWDGLRADPRFRSLLERCGFVGATRSAPGEL